MIPKIISRDLFLLLNDYGRNTKVRKYLRQYRLFDEWEENKKEEYQFLKLSKLIQHAYETVPYWKRRFTESGLNPASIKCFDDLRKIPPLTRKEIQTNPEDLVSSKVDLNRCYRGTSSGSTGEPVLYYHDSYARSAGWAGLYYFWENAGWEFGMKGLHIWGNPQTVQHVWSKRSARIKAKIQNVIKYPAYQLTRDQNLIELVEILKREQFDYIDGYTNAIYFLAKKIQEKNEVIQRMKCILPTGENLQDYQREVIEEMLGPVYDLYGCGEIMSICAQDSERNKYKILPTHVVLEMDEESVDENGCGKLIITDLDNYAMPFLRYSNGDLATFKDYRSDIYPIKTLDEIVGRTSDLVEFPGGGSLVVPSFFGSKLLRLVKGIKQYQIERISINKINIRLAVDNPLSSDDLNLIDNSMQDYLGDKIEWEILQVQQIELDKSGKFKLVIDQRN